MNDKGFNVGLQIEEIGNGYVISGYKSDGWNSNSTGRFFASSIEDVEKNLPALFKESCALLVTEPDDPVQYSMFGSKTR